jgi:predicted transcriptional regulator
MDEFEKNVRIALINQGMTLSDLAEKLEISSSYLYDILKSSRKAGKQRKRIAEILKLNESLV